MKTRSFRLVAIVTLLPILSLLAEGIIRTADAQDRLFIPAGGSQTFLNATTGYTWNFGVTSATNSLVISQVTLPIGSSQGTGDILYRIYNGLGGAQGTGQVIWTGTLANANVPTNPSSATATVTIGGGGLSLGPGAYSLATTATTTANYTIRSSKLGLQSGTTNLSSSLWIEDNNGTGTAGTSLVTTQTVLAQPQVSGTSINFGAFRINGAGTTSDVVLTNTALATSGTAPGTTQTQFLSSTGAASGAAFLSGFNYSGTSTALGAQVSGTFAVGLNSVATQTVGVRSGTVTLTNQSIPGSSPTTGTTNLAATTITVSGTGWQPASASVGTVSLGLFHVGTTAAMATLTGTAQLSNTAPTTGYSEGLLVTGSTSGGNVTVGSVPSGVIAAGGSAAVIVGLTSIATAGVNTGTVTLNMVSSGLGTSGLSNLSLPNQAVVVTGTGYSGQSVWDTDGGGQWGTLANNFGTNWQTFNGSPGLDAGFTNTDTATFSNAVSSGTATVTVTAATPSLKSLTFDNGSASYVIAASSGGSLTLLNAGTAAATVTSLAGNHSVSLPVTLGSDASWSVAAGSRLGMTGVVSGAKDVTKVGAGTLVFSGSNTYSGLTTVSAGTLVVNGDQSAATGEVSVAAGAILAGSGVIGGDTTVAGTHTPGNSPGVQTVSGNLTYEAGSNVIWELINDTVAGRGTNFDGIDVTGTLAFSGATSLDLVFNLVGSGVSWSDSFWASDHSGTNGWLIFDGAASLAGFSNLTISGSNWADGSGTMLQTVREGASFGLHQEGNDVYLVYAVPEPSTFLLAGLGIAAALAAVRRLRR
jgi:autotransporter-associated beta strand protein